MICTEPETWKVVPDEDASDDVIGAYLDHVSHCEYHAEIERRRMMAARMSFAAARSLTSTDALTFSDDEEAEVLRAAKKLEAFRNSDKKISLLSFKIEGHEIDNLKFSRWRSAKVTIPTSKPLQIFGRAADDDPELMLGAYLPLVQKKAGSYILPITEGQALHFNVKPRSDGSVTIKISCVLLPQTHRVYDVDQFRWAPSITRYAFRGVAIILFILVFGVPAFLLYRFSKTEPELPAVVVGPLESPLPSPQPTPATAPPVKPEAPFIAQNRVPRVEPFEGGTRRLSSIESIRQLREVKAIFIRINGTAELDQRIRPELVTALGSKVQILADAEASQADAHLFIRLTRRNNKVVARAELVNRGGNIIWPPRRALTYTQPLSDVEMLGAQIGNKLAADITNARAAEPQR